MPMLATAPITAERVRYIKLGPGGAWEHECVSQGIIRFGFSSGLDHRYRMGLQGRWAKLRADFLAEGLAPGTATHFANETQLFFEDAGTTLWITFAGESFLWGFTEPSAPAPHPSTDSVTRRMLDGWHDTDIAGAPLRKSNLAGSLTKLAGYRGTSCNVDVRDYVVRRINCETIPQVERGIVALREMTEATLAMIRLLDPKDFEILVDLVFSTSGWRRQGLIGKTQKTLDLDLVLPSTGERAFVQVKSRTSPAELADYISRLEAADDYARMFYVYHSGDVATDDSRVVLIGPERIAEMVVEAGLSGWVVRKVS
jgi:hypothetical protein